jgi:hypothetical protein
MSAKAFNSKVAARTRVAVQITETPDLLTKYEKVGGLRRDLEAIAKTGAEAEAANLGQSQARASGRAATEIHRPLAERQVDPARLAALKESAEKLSGLRSDRAAAKGASKTATKEERDAVEKQRRTWGACYRMLSLLADQDERVRSLLKEAAR